MGVLILRYNNDPFYKDRRWIKKRENILKRDNYTCQECKRYGNTTPANTIHHIYPLELYFELRFVNKNLISLCAKCHGKMHNRVTNEITALGLTWQERIGNPDDLEKQISI